MFVPSFLAMTYLQFAAGCVTINIASREQWDANPPDTRRRPLTNISLPAEVVVILSTQTADCLDMTACKKAVKNIQQEQTADIGKDRLNDIGYSFVIGTSGDVFEGRGWRTVPNGLICRGFGRKCYAVGFVGNFTGDKFPSEQALWAAKTLLQCGTSEAYLVPRFRIYNGLNLAESVTEKLQQMISGSAIPDHSTTEPQIGQSITTLMPISRSTMAEVSGNMTSVGTQSLTDLPSPASPTSSSSLALILGLVFAIILALLLALFVYLGVKKFRNRFIRGGLRDPDYLHLHRT